MGESRGTEDPVFRKDTLSHPWSPQLLYLLGPCSGPTPDRRIRSQRRGPSLPSNSDISSSLRASVLDWDHAVCRQVAHSLTSGESAATWGPAPAAHPADSTWGLSGLVHESLHINPQITYKTTNLWPSSSTWFHTGHHSTVFKSSHS